jgi:rubrerythrin
MVLAIGNEVEAYEFYSDAAKKATDSGVKEIFAQLAKEELGHRQLFENYKSDPTLMLKIHAPTDLKITEATPLPKLSTSMKPSDAIALAMKKELQAVEFYKGLAAKAENAGLKDAFTNLANVELGHKNKLENIFVDIGYPESF